jgi:hypothetical protein
MVAKKKPNEYAFDVMSPAMGAVRVFQHRLGEQGLTVQRGGDGFSILSKFPYLSLASKIEDAMRYVDMSTSPVTGEEIVKQAQRACDHRGYYDVTPTNNIMVPSEASASTTNVNSSIGIGGIEHEIGHAIYDLANVEVATSTKVTQLAPTIERFLSKGYKPKNLHKWTNLTADMRLERWLVKEYPLTQSRLWAVQDWIYALEAPTRADKSKENFSSHVMMYLRDVGKGHYNASYQRVKGEYHPQAVALVDGLDYLWKLLIPRDGDTVEDTAHLPLLIALSIMEAIEDGVPLPPPPPPPGGGGGGGGGDPQPPSPPKGGGDEGDDEGGDGGEGEDEGEGDEKGENDPPSSPSNQGGDPIGEKELEDLFKDGQALDPSSAYEEAKKQRRATIDHKVYAGTGERYSVKGKLF